MISFTNGQTIFGTLSQNTTPANLALYGTLANIEHRYLLQKYFSNEGSFSIQTVAQQQFYNMPPNYSKLKTLTITIGNLKWTPEEVLTREQWDKLNVFPYYGDIPNNYFIYPGGDHGGQIGIWPIPSTTGNTITFNYKFRVPDLSIADYTTPGSVAINNGAINLTGTSTSFTPTTNIANESRWIQLAQPTGDNLWYQIANISTATALTLFGAYQGINISGSSTFTIGQMPILAEDFQDMLIWKSLVYYYTSIVDKPGKRQEYQDNYDRKLELLAEYSGSNTIHVNLGRRPPMMNPNLFPQSIG